MTTTIIHYANIEQFYRHRGGERSGERDFGVWHIDDCGLFSPRTNWPLEPETIRIRVDSGRGQNSTLRLLSTFWPPVFATLPPAGHVATISQELSRCAGSTHTIMAVNYSVCPSGQGDPDCFSNRLNRGALMRGYVTTPRHCQIGKRYNWVHIAVATLTVEGVTYSGLDGDNARIRCRDMRN